MSKRIQYSIFDVQNNSEEKHSYDKYFAVPICMPPDGADFTGKMATVSGWGRLKYGGGVPSVLQEVNVSTKIAFMLCS